MRFTIHAFLALAVLAGCPGPRRPAPPPAAPPRLIVLVVIDQLPAWSFPAKAAAATDGIARLLGVGRHFTARYPYAATQTAPGHAALGTGAPPSVSGILSNEWWHRDQGREMRAADDPAGGSSAVWLRVDGLADVLTRGRHGAKAVGVALKDRSAILSLGHAGLAVWYDDACPCFVSNAGDAAPPWLAALAAEHPIAPRLADPWIASDPDRLATLSGSPDDAPGELSIPGWTATFPHDLATAPVPAKAVVDTPLGDEIVVEAAIAAIRGEGLGADAAPDYLVVSFSAHDYVNHAFGPDSWESWDTWLALDRQIGDLLRALDAEVGAGEWAMILTSDHGGPELPERRQARGLTGARFSYEDIATVAETAAATVAGEGDWIAAARYPTIYLTDAARALADETRAALIDAVVSAVAAMPGIDRATPTAALTGDCARFSGDDRALCLSIDPERSGEIIYDPAEGSVIHKDDWVDAISHGSLHDYDREVPLVLVGPGVTPGDAADLVSPLQVAPTIARFLGVAAPSGATEPALPLR
jgi:predicted AlkP superfamily pyrophosphatase or phosphodiesterase